MSWLVERCVAIKDDAKILDKVCTYDHQLEIRKGLPQLRITINWLKCWIQNEGAANKIRKSHTSAELRPGALIIGIPVRARWDSKLFKILSEHLNSFVKLNSKPGYLVTFSASPNPRPLKLGKEYV